MNIVAVKTTKDGKVDITLEELNKMLEKAYQRGFEVGKECGKNYTYPNISPLTTPTNPSPYNPINPIWYCNSTKDIPCNINGTSIDNIPKENITRNVAGVSGPNSSFSEVNL